MRRKTALPALLAAAVLACTGCGGDDDGDDSGSNGSEATPAETILADAGLDVCGEAQDQIAQSTVSEGVTNIRGFAVAEDCGGSEIAPDTITIFQFTSTESRDTGARALAAGPRTVVMTSGALAIVANGPSAEANADAVGQAYADSTGAPVETVSR